MASFGFSLFDMISHVPSLTLRDLFLIVPPYDTNLSIGGNSLTILVIWRGTF